MLSAARTTYSPLIVSQCGGTIPKGLLVDGRGLVRSLSTIEANPLVRRTKSRVLKRALLPVDVRVNFSLANTLRSNTLVTVRGSSVRKGSWYTPAFLTNGVYYGIGGVGTTSSRSKNAFCFGSSGMRV